MSTNVLSLADSKPNSTAKMKLLTKELCREIPELYSQEEVDDPLVHVKYFHPLSSATWLVTEGSVVSANGNKPLTEYGEHDEVRFFGYAELHPGMGELGYMSLWEMESVKVFGLGVERDLHWEPCPLSEAKAKCGVGQ